MARGYGLLNDSGLIPLTVGGLNLDLSATGGTSQFLKQNTLGGTPTLSRPAASDLSDYTTWTDYSGTSTVVGWSSTTTKDIRYFVIGKMVVVIWTIIGTSNSTASTFTIPFTSINSANFLGFNMGAARDNGAAYISAQNYIPINSGTINLGATAASYTWTGSGTKGTEGMMIVPVQ